ncbi:EAL domain-containing protein [Stenotrophomonas maltophilia]|uniref:EAL domain-containing protein n=1 Tax=Stenotrophomonas maltophilia TaxID=40324 RepID=UPI0009BEC23E|nr:EAL domain-containing protein [Stenotrophomonas maltophilia]
MPALPLPRRTHLLASPEPDHSSSLAGLRVDEFILHYQPKLDLVTDRICGVEALLRWNHPTDGLLAPDNFLHSIRASGGLHSVERWVVMKACRDLRQWHLATGRSDLQVAINISPSHLKADGFTSMILDAVRASELKPEHLILEITEAEPIQDVSYISKVTHMLNERGVQFSLDDFGTGYSSLTQICQLPVTEVKVDRGFVAGIPESRSDWMIVHALIHLARALGVRVVAEGVERSEQLAALRELECDVIQGFYVACALPECEILNLLLSPERGAVQARYASP